MDESGVLLLLVGKNTTATNVSLVGIRYRSVESSTKFGPPEKVGTGSTSTIYVVKGSTVLFHAIANPDGAQFPATSLSWSGTAGASGSADAATVTFGNISTTASPYLTVLVAYNHTTTITINVVVYSITPAMTYGPEFQGTTGIAHDPKSLGVGEPVQLGYVTNPTIVGPIIEREVIWSDWSGSDSFHAGSNGAGTATYVAPELPCKDTFTLSLISGPSAGYSVSLPQQSVILPGLYQISTSSPEKVYHDGLKPGTPPNTPGPSVGSLRRYCLWPTNVSWVNVEIEENDCCANPGASGTLSSAVNTFHMGGAVKMINAPWYVFQYSSKDMAWESAQPDSCSFIVSNIGSGHAEYDIKINYKLRSSTQGYFLSDQFEMIQTFDENSGGNATVAKWDPGLKAASNGGGYSDLECATVAPFKDSAGNYTPYVGPYPPGQDIEGRPYPAEW
jgi:hypothetical protein